MTIAYRPPSTKVIPPVPPEFASEWQAGGWKRVERIYGARTDLILKWLEISGCHRKRALPSVNATSVKR